MTDTAKEPEVLVGNVVPAQENMPVVRSDNELIAHVISQGATPEILKQFMDLKERNEANEARKSYHRAMAAFKANPPEITKDAHVNYSTSKGTTDYRHASLAHVTEVVNRALSEHGLSAAWKTSQENGITVTCTITHELGHSESTSLSAASDMSGGKNAIQGIGSTVSYLQRYTLLALTGLAAKGQDDDGQSASPREPGEPDLYEQWEIKLDESAANNSLDELKEFWKANSKQIKSDLSTVQAAKLNSRKNRLKKELEGADK